MGVPPSGDPRVTEAAETRGANAGIRDFPVSPAYTSPRRHLIAMPIRPILLLIPCLLGVFGHGATFIYDSFDAKTHAPCGRFTRIFSPGPGTERRCVETWSNHPSRGNGGAEYRLSADDGTLAFDLRQESTRSRYRCERQGDELRFKGVFKGKEMDKRVGIDAAPFFFSPTIGLQGFARSGKPKADFWVVDRGLDPRRMTATREGEENLKLGERELRAIRVRWTPSGLLSPFFSQTVWLRAEDGLYLTSTPALDEYQKIVSGL